jgi:SAM-dependent methyltransferase
MNRGLRSKWEARHRGASAGGAERSLIEILPLLPRGIALDVAAGTGRNSLALARAGLRVVAADFSATAMRGLHEAARQHRLPISTVVTDFEEGFPFRPQTFDAIINVSFLERGLVPHLKNALRAGGILFFDTFLTDPLRAVWIARRYGAVALPGGDRGPLGRQTRMAGDGAGASRELTPDGVTLDV